MECRRFRSVVSIMEPLPGRRSSTVSPTPSVPVSGKSLSFSISASAILGLEDDRKQHDLPKKERNTQSSELRVQIPNPQHSYSDTSPQSSPCSDNTSSSSSCNSEPDQASPHAEHPVRRKRKRTTFSPIELWELERAYKLQPYLTSDDEKDLVRRLGITARSLKYWFQNRRAKSRKEEAYSASNPVSSQTNLSNQFAPPVSRRMESWQPLRPHFPVTYVRHGFFTVQSNRSDQLYETSPMTVNHRSAIKSTQFRRCRSFQLPMFHPDQFQFRPIAKAAKLPLRQAFHRYKPY